MTEIITTKNATSIVAVGVIIIIAGVISSSLVTTSRINGSYVDTATLPPVLSLGIMVLGIILLISSFFVVVKQYERGVILKFGKYTRTIKGGIQFRIPFVEQVFVVDIRETVSEFEKEDMMTKDNVPVKIDSILKYKIEEDKAKDAVLNVDDFNNIIEQSSQTALRTCIGSSELQTIIADREAVNKKIEEILKTETEPWGVKVTGVEVKNLILPKELEHAMSMEAQAEREKRARLTYANSEIEIAEKFKQTADMYKESAMAYALRQSNMLNEAIKSKGNTVILVPSEQLNHIGYGNIAMIEGYMKQRKEVADAKPDKITSIEEKLDKLEKEIKESKDDENDTEE